ncbi:hypothetical protein DITRI_Ditri08aG0013500 [Diplodiscus trichospermus]
MERDKEAFPPRSELLIIRIINITEDGNTIVKQEQDEEKKERGATDTMDTVGFTGGENGGDGAMVGGKELDREENDGLKVKTNRTQQLGNGFTLFTKQEWS